jgi:hypothetical protein
MAKITIDLTKEELEEAVREYAADKLEMTGEIAGAVKFTYSGTAAKEKREVNGASVTLERE